MLKRHGEQCQIQVPGFSGRLTQTEYSAYKEAVSAVEDQIKQLSESRKALTNVEKEFREWPEIVTDNSSVKSEADQSSRNPSDEWERLHTLSKSDRNEIAFCARQADGGKEYGIVEYFDSNSSFAAVHGTYEVLMTGNNARTLLQDHLENERSILKLLQKDVQLTVEETLSEKHPGQNLGRVVRAIAGACGDPRKNESEFKQTPAITNDRKMSI